MLIRKFLKHRNLLVVLIFLVTVQISGIFYFYEFAPLVVVKNLFDFDLYNSSRIYTKLSPDEYTKQFFQKKIMADIPNITEMTPLDKQIALRKWTRNSLTNLSAPVSTEEKNPVNLYQELRTGKASGTCGRLSLLYAYALDSFGFKFRFVQLVRDISLFKHSYADSHVVVEVWSNKYNKWYVSDPTFDGYFVDKEGIPMNALEIREAVYKARKELRGTGTTNLAYTHKIKFERNGDKEKPTLDSYYIDPFLIYNDIFIRGGQLYNSHSFLDKIKSAFDRIYRKTSVAYYLVDKYHPPLILDKIYLYLFYINPILILILGAWYLIKTKKDG